jgi:MFS family permease
MTMAIGASLIFAGILMWSIQWPVVGMLLVGMAVWGVYYEFLGFGSQQMVAESIAKSDRTKAWATIGVFKSLAYFLGPILGSSLILTRGNVEVVYLAAGCVLVGFVFWKVLKFAGKEKIINDQETERLNLLDELSHWKALFTHVWPILIISLMLGLVDATFWTTGTVFSDILARENLWGGMFLPLYMLPPVVVGIFLSRWGIKSGKKKISELFLLLGGVCLSLLGVTEVVWLLLLGSLLTGVMLSIAWPMMEAVYSDIVARMGRERKHMLGLSNSTTSIAYIIGPVAAGWLSSVVGERMTFVVVGLFTVVISLVLLWVTPKKLKLPQAEISTWE